MALLLADSFEDYYSEDYWQKHKWYTKNGAGWGLRTQTTNVKTGSAAMDCGNGSLGEHEVASGFPNQEVFCQFHMYRGYGVTYYDYIWPVLYFMEDFIADEQSCLCLVDGRYFAVYRGDQLSQEAISDYPLQKGVWHFVQVKWTVTNSTVTDDVIVKVDGNEILNPVGADTQNMPTSTFLATLLSKSGSIYHNFAIDNFCMMDNQGSLNNGFTTKDTFIECLTPNGIGNYSDWTAGAGTNYLQVDDASAGGANHDGDTTYVESGTNSDKDSYQYSNIATSSPTIKAVCANIRARSTTATARDIRQFVRISSTDYFQSGTKTVTYSTTYWDTDMIIWEESPATATAWTKSEVDGAEFGIEVNS